MKILLPAEPVHPTGETLISLFCGAPALALGVSAVILLLSYVVGEPIGPSRFYTTELVRVDEYKRLGQVSVISRKYIFPSPQLLLMLSAGICCGAFGIYLTRRRGRRRRKATTSVIGTIVCGVALLAAWTIFVWAALL